MKTFLIGIGLMAVCLCSPALAQTDAPVPVTLKELLDNYKKYDRKTVRVRGQVDNCVMMAWRSCYLCDEDMVQGSKPEDGHCIGLEFEGYSGSDNPVLHSASKYMDEAFRFATVTLDAHFDADCIASYRDIAQPDFVCLDGNSMLELARVQTVHSRKNALTGLVNRYDFGKLTAPSEQDQQEMLTAFKALFEDGEMTKINMFRVSDNSYLKNGGLACVGWQEDGKYSWPDRYFGGFNSPANPFRCFEMEKKDGVWRVLPN